MQYNPANFEIIDIVNKSDLISLQQIPYQYYHHTLPNQGLMLSAAGLSEDSGYKFNTEKTTVERAKLQIGRPSLAKPVLLGAGIVLFLILINSGDDDDDYDNDDYY